MANYEVNELSTNSFNPKVKKSGNAFIKAAYSVPSDVIGFCDVCNGPVFSKRNSTICEYCNNPHGKTKHINNETKHANEEITNLTPESTVVAVKTIAPMDASVNTHNQMRLICRDCNKTVIIWHPKGATLPSCPNCGSFGERVRIKKISSIGECMTEAIWDEPDGTNIPMPKLKREICSCKECGYPMRYLFSPPTECANCKAKKNNKKIMS